jgi:NADH-quinone oxidoreductase subunit J
LAVGLGALLAAEVVYIVFKGVDLIGDSGGEAIAALNRDPGNVLAIARLLFSRYLMPFEATSILLVVAVVGVMVLTRRISDISDIEVPSEPVAREPVKEIAV